MAGRAILAAKLSQQCKAFPVPTSRKNRIKSRKVRKNRCCCDASRIPPREHPSSPPRIPEHRPLPDPSNHQIRLADSLFAMQHSNQTPPLGPESPYLQGLGGDVMKGGGAARGRAPLLHIEGVARVQVPPSRLVSWPAKLCDSDGRVGKGMPR